MPTVTIEREHRRAAYGAWKRAILETLTATGLTTLTALLDARRGIRAIDQLPRVTARIIRQTLRRLNRLELVSMVERNGEITIRITRRGHAMVLRGRLAELELKKPRRWDRRWRVVAFDVPERHRLARNALRQKLQSLHFHPMQRSVYITPYPCENEISFLCEVYGIRPFVQCFEVRSINRALDRKLQAIFRHS